MKDNVLLINPHDNVFVALRDLKKDEPIVWGGSEKFLAREDIPASHKIARQDITGGAEIIKYGEVVAISKKEIKQGEWVHTHNLESQRWKK